ncbi:MAG: hypothetical protein CVV51_10330 [Spirochaetae bacterium HGW-Spirochaetae-7]|jgi:hypothetical protein|nr:MAG: hypothetical protein CVV51_10330 [Spirochaetae bacterium HGW-Spirochaetae-7]
MADGNKETRRRFGRRGRGRSGPKAVEPATGIASDAEPSGEQGDVSGIAPKDQVAVVCSICQKQIFDLSSALAGRDGGTPVHFDCALAKASEGEPLEPSERVAYVGRGAFAVVEYRDKSMTAFTIKRRIQWEKEGEKFDWRRNIQKRLGL